MDESHYHDDILENVTDDELEVLACMYKNQSEIPHASNVLSNVKTLRKKGCHLITILSPRREKGDGTFFALMEFGKAYQLAVFTLDKTGETVFESLTKTRRIEFERPVLFFAIHNSIFPTIERVLETKNMKTKFMSPAYHYSIPKAKAMLFNVQCPDDVKLGNIEMHHSQIVHSTWSFKDTPNSLEYVCSLIENIGGVCLFLKSTNEPVAWVLKNAIGELGLLHTLEKHRNKGFASIVMKQLSRQIALEDEDPIASIFLSNAASKNLVEKLGFKNLGALQKRRLIGLGKNNIEMNEGLGDILVDIPDESLDSLADTYRRCSNIPYASSLLRNGKKLRHEGKSFITFMSPRDSWKEDGTFFALMQFPNKYHVAIFTLSDSGEKVYESLMKTKRIDFNKNNVVFYALPSSLYPTVSRVTEELNLKTQKTVINYIYTISKEDAIHFQIECPPDVEVAKLENCHANLVSSAWVSAFPGSDEYVAAFIENNGGIGLFVKSTNELVAWVLKTSVGKIGILHTLEQYRKKGYASILMKMLSKQVAQEGENPTTTVSLTNTASMKLMEQLGMRNVGSCYYITLSKRDI